MESKRCLPPSHVDVADGLGVEVKQLLASGPIAVLFSVGGQALDSIVGSRVQTILPAQMDGTIVERKQQLLSLLPGVTIPHE
jgi:hypothetical protein